MTQAICVQDSARPGPRCTGCQGCPEAPRCVFCDIIAGNAPAEFVLQEKRVVAFAPLNPVAPGHLLVVPRLHVRDYTENPSCTAETMGTAARLAQTFGGQSNLITSAGPLATQSVFHLHVHIVPRREDDGLHLPWTGREPTPLTPGSSAP